MPRILTSPPSSGGGATVDDASVNGVISVAGASRTTIEGIASGLDAPAASQHASGLYYIADDHGLASASSSLMVANTGYFKPFYLDDDITVTALACAVASGVALSTIRLGIYSMVDGVPVTLLAGTDAIDTSTNGARSETLGTPLVLPRGMYAACTKSEGVTTATMSGSASHRSRHVGLAAPNGNQVQCYSAAGMSAGALPATAPAVAASASGVPAAIWFKVQ